MNNPRSYVSDTATAVFDLLLLELNVARLCLAIKNPATLSSFATILPL